jgi:hypothetical protein
MKRANGNCVADAPDQSAEQEQLEEADGAVN